MRQISKNNNRPGYSDRSLRSGRVLRRPRLRKIRLELRCCRRKDLRLSQCPQRPTSAVRPRQTDQVLLAHANLPSNRDLNLSDIQHSKVTRIDLNQKAAFAAV